MEGIFMSKHIDYEINRELGECYLFMGEFDKAADYYKKAVGCETGHADPFLGLATIAVQRGILDEAGEHYRTALSLTPSDKAYAGLGLVEMEQGAHSEAFEHFGAALSMNSGNMIAMNSMLRLAYKLGRVEEMLPRFDALLRDGDNDAVRFTMAGCLSCLGRNNEALKHLEILLGKDPSNAQAKELYAHLAA
jgi:tetratricopeptide (TPR) repeat protein